LREFELALNTYLERFSNCQIKADKTSASRLTKIETTKATKRNLISDDLQQLSLKVVISVDFESTDLSRAGNWCFETETEEPTNQRLTMSSN